jgi:hypothetical protein
VNQGEGCPGERQHLFDVVILALDVDNFSLFDILKPGKGTRVNVFQRLWGYKGFIKILIQPRDQGLVMTPRGWIGEGLLKGGSSLFILKIFLLTPESLHSSYSPLAEIDFIF